MSRRRTYRQDAVPSGDQEGDDLEDEDHAEFAESGFYEFEEEEEDVADEGEGEASVEEEEGAIDGGRWIWRWIWFCRWRNWVCWLVVLVSQHLWP